MSDPNWQVFDLDQVKAAMNGASVEYKEFLRVPALSCGVYHLAAGSKDMQSPHDEDEVYFVLSGRARMSLDEEERVGLEPLGAVDEAALAAADPVPGKVGRAHGEAAAGECLGSDTHTWESRVRAESVEE